MTSRPAGGNADKDFLDFRALVRQRKPPGFEKNRSASTSAIGLELRDEVHGHVKKLETKGDRDQTGSITFSSF